MRDRYSMSGPEEGDVIDDTVLIVDDDGTELIEIKFGTLTERKYYGRLIARLLNEAEAEFPK